MIDLLLPALGACIVLTAVHGYFGVHVLMREVVFADLALAQLAALGAACARAAFPEAPAVGVYAASFAFTLAGAGLFSGLQAESRRVPQEALIGIVYGVSAALVVLVLSKSALDRDQIQHMLTGHLLFVSGAELAVSAALCAGVGLVHLGYGARFVERSQRARRPGPVSGAERRSDFVFYATFGAVVTSSVQIAGVLVVFGLLVIPAAAACTLAGSLRARLGIAWAIGTLGSLAGIACSALWDLPTGPSVVVVLGLLFSATWLRRA